MTKIFEEELHFLNQVEDKNDECYGERDTYDTNTIEKLKIEFPNLPNDYFCYLQEIGWGSFRECSFMVYSSPANLQEFGVGDLYVNIPANYIFFGDDMSGDYAGFDITATKDEVIELWHEDETIYQTKKTFKQYIREKMRFKKKKI